MESHLIAFWGAEGRKIGMIKKLMMQKPVFPLNLAQTGARQHFIRGTAEMMLNLGSHRATVGRSVAPVAPRTRALTSRALSGASAQTLLVQVDTMRHIRASSEAPSPYPRRAGGSRSFLPPACEGGTRKDLCCHNLHFSTAYFLIYPERLA